MMEAKFSHGSLLAGRTAMSLLVGNPLQRTRKVSFAAGRTMVAHHFKSVSGEGMARKPNNRLGAVVVNDVSGPAGQIQRITWWRS